MRGEGPFRRFFDEVGASPDLRRFVLAELIGPARRWHRLLHHALMLRQVAKADHRGDDRRRLIRAVLFHDIVYEATRSDNEEQSALVARRWLPTADAEPVARLILATKAHDLAAADPLTRTLLDADLAVLWTPSTALYRFYAEGIRAEYAHVPDAAYRTGRAAVLTALEQRIRPTLDDRRATWLARNLRAERTDLAAGRFDLGV